MSHKRQENQTAEGVTMMQLCDMFPTEESAREWFESRVWPSGTPLSGDAEALNPAKPSHAPHAILDFSLPDSISPIKIKVQFSKAKIAITSRQWCFAIHFKFD